MIKLLEKGATPTLLEADKGNELINIINALSNMTVVRGSTDNFQIGYNGAVLTILARDADGSTEEDDEQGDGGGGEHTHPQETISLYICENGNAVQKTFLLQASE